jgi:hypothetical protein
MWRRAELVRAAALVALVAAGGVLASAQRGYSPPPTAWGDPDLQGIWPSGPLNFIPFERQQELGTRATLTEEEFASLNAAVAEQVEIANAETIVPGSRTGVNPPAHWLEPGRASRQASLIVDPPDGRLPPMTADGTRRAAAWPHVEKSYFAGPGDFTPYDRCITRGVLGSAFPNLYGTGMEILQSPGLVVIRHEMVHETRIVPLDPSTSSGSARAPLRGDGRPRPAPAIRSYMGDPRGRWEGSTLVVETTNFNGRTGSLARNGNGNPTSEALRLVERFTLTGPDTLHYEVVVDDPQTWTRPWTVAFPLERDSGYVMYEYACHEGNYALANVLAASRAADRARQR